MSVCVAGGQERSGEEDKEVGWVGLQMTVDLIRDSNFGTSFWLLRLLPRVHSGVS